MFSVSLHLNNGGYARWHRIGIFIQACSRAIQDQVIFIDYVCKELEVCKISHTYSLRFKYDEWRGGGIGALDVSQIHSELVLCHQHIIIRDCAILLEQTIITKKHCKHKWSAPRPVYGILVKHRFQCPVSL